MSVTEPAPERRADVSRITAEPLLYREITVSVRGKATPTICPIWCTLDHDAERVNALSDVSHFSPMVRFSAPNGSADQAPVGEVNLYWTPDDEAQRNPLLLVWGDGDAAEYDLPAAKRLLGKLAGLIGQMEAYEGATA